MLHTIKSSDEVVAFVIANLGNYPYLLGKDNEVIEREVLNAFDSYYDDYLDSMN